MIAVNELSLESAIRFAIFDRGKSWYNSCQRRHELPDFNKIYQKLADFNQWDYIVKNTIAERKVMTAPNGKNYQMTILPLDLFAIRYYLVYEMSKYVSCSWNSRCGTSYHTTSEKNSLFVGNLHEHKTLFKSWTRSRKESYILKLDIKKFYGSIQHEILINQLRTFGQNIMNCTELEYWESLVELCEMMLPVRYIQNGKQSNLEILTRGLPIGNTTERFFSNFYLRSLDEYLTRLPNVVSSRSIDDITVYSNDFNELSRIKRETKTILHGIGLLLNPKKTKISQNFYCLKFL